MVRTHCYLFLKSLPLSDLALAKRILLPRGKKGDHKAIEEQCENHPTALPTATFQPSTIATNIRNPSPTPPRDIPCDNIGYIFCIIAGVLCALMAARITQQAAQSSQLSTIRFASSAGSVVAMLIGFSLLGEFSNTACHKETLRTSLISASFVPFGIGFVLSFFTLCSRGNGDPNDNGPYTNTAALPASTIHQNATVHGVGVEMSNVVGRQGGSIGSGDEGGILTAQVVTLPTDRNDPSVVDSAKVISMASVVGIVEGGGGGGGGGSLASRLQDLEVARSRYLITDEEHSTLRQQAMQNF